MVLNDYGLQLGTRAAWMMDTKARPWSVPNELCDGLIRHLRLHKTDIEKGMIAQVGRNTVSKQ